MPSALIYGKEIYEGLGGYLPPDLMEGIRMVEILLKQHGIKD